MADEGQEEAFLPLPHMGHFVDEQPLRAMVVRAEIIAPPRTLWMEPDVTIGSHDRVAGLKECPFPLVQADRPIIDRIAEHTAGHGGLAQRQRAPGHRPS
jgi:hypothetical protein